MTNLDGEKYMFSVQVYSYEYRVESDSPLTTILVSPGRDVPVPTQALFGHIVQADGSWNENIGIDIQNEVYMGYVFFNLLQQCGRDIKALLRCCICPANRHLHGSQHSWSLRRIDLYLQRKMEIENMHSFFLKIFSPPILSHLVVTPEPVARIVPEEGATAITLQKFNGVLMPHQLHTLAWIMEKEQQCAAGNMKVRMRAPVALGSGLHLTYKNGLKLESNMDIVNTQTMPTAGWVLNNAIGHGKTANMIAACSEVPCRSYSGDLFPSRASLVIVPVNLCGQWCNEIQKFWPSATIFVINDIRKMKSATPEQLSNSDFVLTTMNFIKGKSYNLLFETLIKGPQLRLHEEARKSLSKIIIRNHVTKLTSQERVVAEELRPPCFIQCFHFQRVIFDELHEMSERSLPFLQYLSADIVWGITANTPTSTSVVPSLLLGRDRHNTGYFDSSNVFACCDKVARPPLEYTIHLVRPSAVEMAAIECRPTEEEKVRASTGLRSIESADSSLITAGTMEEILEKMQVDLSNTVHTLNQRLGRLRELLQQIGSEPDRLLIRLRDESTQKIEAIQAQVEVTEKHARFLMNTTARGTSEEDSCPICMTTPTSVLFECGHGTCLSCQQILKTRSRSSTACCPLCRHVSSKFYNVCSSPGSHEGCKFRPFLNLVNSKLEKGESTVVFVQWASSMTVIYNFLKEHLPVMRLCGNANTRKKVLSAFESGPPSVLLLSIDSSNSGLNLVRGSTVVFLHTMVGGRSSRMDKVKQAVGRVDRIGQNKKVTVHMFIVAGSTEEDMFNSDRELWTEFTGIQDFESTVISHATEE